MSETFSVLLARAAAKEPWRPYSDVARDLGKRLAAARRGVTKSARLGQHTATAAADKTLEQLWYNKD